MSSSYIPDPPHAAGVEHTQASTPRLRSQPAIFALLGRILFALIFILSSFGQFTQANINLAAGAGVPLANVMTPIAGVISLIGGLSILFGVYTRVGAWLVIVFLAPVTLFFHNFWTVQEPAMRAMQEANFMKNIALMGGALLIAYFGAGPMSFDRRR